jgi:LuxR family maltose regulon positive regulatory protein
MLHLKLEVPRLPSNVVHRSRLMTALGSVLTFRLVLVTAPAGFGKTTLLSQWRDQLINEDGRVAWLTLDESDNNVRRFLIGVIRSLEMAGLELDGLSAQAERGLTEVTIDSVIRDLQGLLGLNGLPVTLILDDYHRASSPALDEFLGRWIPLLPDGARLLMSTRRRPMIGLHHLLGSGEAVEITSDMLRFTAHESRQVLDVGLAEAERDALAERTEGWPVALQLARLITLQGQADPHALTRLMARGGHLWGFLSDQVLRGLSEEAVDFLLETSILERFSVEITDAVRGRDDSWRIMEQLEPLQSLLAPLDAEAIWYRYHHLFAEYLQAQLRQRRPSAISALHLRASMAFEQCDLLAEAVRHASLAGDFVRCSELVEQAGGWRLVLFGGMGQLNQLLDYIPPAERLSHPRLLIAEAYVNLKLGHLREARSTFDLVDRAIPEPPPDWAALNDYERDILNIGVLIRTYEDNTVEPAFLKFFETFQARFPNADGLTRGVLDCAGAVANLCIGQLERAEDFARKAMAGMREANSVLGLNYCFLHAGMACSYRGELTSAAAYLQRAKAMAIENFGSDSGLKAIAEILLCMVQLWSGGKLATSPDDLDEAFRHVCDYDGWFEIYAAGLDSRFRLAWLAHDFEAMNCVIADGDDIVRIRGLDRLASIVDAQRLLRHAAAHQDSPSAWPLAEALAARFPVGGWQENPACWRPYQDVGFALTDWLLKRDRQNLKLARARAADLLACAQAIGARFYEIRALLLLAHVEAEAGQDYQAMVHLRAAVGIAARSDIALPFVEQRQLAPLIRQLKRDLWDSGGDPVEASFLSDIDDRLSATVDTQDGPMALLSPREQEVMAELAGGLTNKEIARVLDMTEHTVKFHLKNIFVKLGVDRRAHALAALRDSQPGKRP